jgi:hypothetical protein
VLASAIPVQGGKPLARQLLRVLAQMGDSSAAHIVRPVHDQTRGWEWVSEPL